MITAKEALQIAKSNNSFSNFMDEIYEKIKQASEKGQLSVLILRFEDNAYYMQVISTLTECGYKVRVRPTNYGMVDDLEISWSDLTHRS